MTDNLPEVIRTDAVELGTLRANSPDALVQGATKLAKPLADIIKTQNLSKKIRGKEFVKCEGWTTLAAMLGVTPHEVATTERDGVYTSTIELRRVGDGQPVSRASAECGAPDEFDNNGNPLWSARPAYARRSMAQTRATSKACRLAFSWIMVLAGYDATPLEEMESVRDVTPRQTSKGNGPTVPFGTQKGTPLTAVSEPELIKMRDWAASKDKFVEFQQQVNEELERRRAELSEVPDAVRDEVDAVNAQFEQERTRSIARLKDDMRVDK
jgi:hypothetical protein